MNHQSDRPYWISTLVRLAEPVLGAMADGQLRATMPVEAQPGQRPSRVGATHLEALGRTLCGIAPWLECESLDGEEAEKRDRLADLGRSAITHAVDPDSPDHLEMRANRQNLVDSAFLSQAMLRAPGALYAKLDPHVQQRLARAIEGTRVLTPPPNNWLLFSATNEAWLCSIGRWWDAMRVDYALGVHETYYLGGGLYSDGPRLKFDYYNSFVIQPMMIDVLRAIVAEQPQRQPKLDTVLERGQTGAALLEQLINADGTFPAIGRSITYRFGVFQLLGHLALLQQLPEGLPPAQVRTAMTAALRRIIEMPGTFDENGWLRIGLAGHQPSLGEGYISTGSLYLCTFGLLPLGLGQTAPFWADPPRDWTAKRLWAGEDVNRVKLETP